MNREDIIRMAREAGFQTGLRDYADGDGAMPFVAPVATGKCLPEIERLVQAAYTAGAAAKDKEHKEAMRWDIHSCGPTCTRYACVAVREAVAAEREACAKIADTISDKYGWGHYGNEVDTADEIAAAIRARGQA